MAISVLARARRRLATKPLHHSVLLLVAAATILSVFSRSPAIAADATDSAERLILRVGVPNEIRTRNMLPAIANDESTAAVHYRVYGSIVLRDVSGRPTAYVAKGVDFDEDGMFEHTEYNVWAERPNATSSTKITVYYDFNGVLWHDGVQMTVWDLLFSYHVNAQNARFATDLRVLFCTPWGSYEGCGRQLSVSIVAKNWEGEGTMPGDADLRAAIQYTLNEPFARFYDSTLFPVMMPMHEWSRTYGGKHADFGCAIWIPDAQAALEGIAECGTADTTQWGEGIASAEPVPGSRPYNYPAAEQWNLADADVIGHGPFRFGHWIRGAETVVLRNDGFFTGEGYDARLAAVLPRPTIEGIRFVAYPTELRRAMGLKAGEIDVMPRSRYHPTRVPSLASDLMMDPRIQVLAVPEYGYAYLAYNMRRAPWGYENNDPTKDVGYSLRQAIAHAIDKEAIIEWWLGGLGAVAHGFVSPTNRFWHNDKIAKPEFNLTRARDILDSPEARANGTGPDPSGPCSRDTPSGCRSLAGIGNAPFELRAFPLWYDRVRYAAGLQLAEAMRSLGLNAELTESGLSDIAPPWTWRYEFDLILLQWVIGPGEPDYLFNFFHSGNALFGQNYCGLRSQEFDFTIAAARSEITRDLRRDRFFEAQAILADLRPCEPLYYPANVEAFRQDRFVDWTEVDGSIWNDWSLFRIRPPSAEALRLTVDAPAIAPAGSDSTLVFSVSDSEGLALAKATLTANIAQTDGLDPGLLTARNDSGTTVSVETDVSGRGVLVYRAPDTDRTRLIHLHVVAAGPSFSSRAWDALIRVLPAGPRSLQVTLSFPTGTVGLPQSTIPLTVLVTDRAGRTVRDAIVEVISGDSNLVRPNPTAGVAADMGRIELAVDGRAAGDVVLTVRASRSEKEEGIAVAVVSVVDTPKEHRCETGLFVGDPSDCPPPELRGDFVPTIAIVATGAVLAVAATWLVRRRNRGRPNLTFRAPRGPG